MVGVLFGSVFAAVLCAYLCTEFLLNRFEVRRRVLIGEGSLPVLFAANITSLVIVLTSGLVLIAASGTGLYFFVTMVALFAQAVWLIQHLWFYYRDHLRLSYEN